MQSAPQSSQPRRAEVPEGAVPANVDGNLSLTHAPIVVKDNGTVIYNR